MDTLWKTDLATLKKIKPKDETSKKIIREEANNINQNDKNLASFLKSKGTSSRSKCREKECPLLAEVVKSKQLMYLYIGGELKDSFAVSTGIPRRETPDMNVRASGPVFIKYTSTKYPEGDYKGLGNMPYAVFVKGGYAIHGTTPGYFLKLGKKASHGCIRLHPDNAKLFYELVNIIGVNNTWVIVR
jgi:lipoprotein-anchoring transpeptidase ErfK/SrfK